MKKMLILGALALAVTQTYAFDYEGSAAWNLALAAIVLKPAVQYAAIAGGATVGLWGLWSMGPHLKVVKNGYNSLAKKIEDFTKNYPKIKEAAKYTAPVVALPIAYKLIQWGIKE